MDLLVAALHQVVAASNVFMNRFKKLLKDPEFFSDWQELLFDPQGREDEYDEGMDPQEIADYVGYEVPEGDEFDTDHEDFEDVANQYLQKRFSSFEKRFSKAKITDGKLEIYRCISVDDPKELLEQIKGKEGPGLGIFWSFSRDHAECYHGNKEHDIILTALVTPKDVEMYRTLAVNLEPQGTEDEISTYENHKLLVIKADLDGKVLWEGKKKVLT